MSAPSERTHEATCDFFQHGWPCTCSPRKGGPTKSAHIFVPLAREPFEKFERGEKSIEIRNRWSPVGCAVLKALRGTRVTLSLGYGKQRRLTGYLGVVYQQGQGITYLPSNVKRRAALNPKTNIDYFDDEGPIVAFEVLEVRPIGD